MKYQHRRVVPQMKGLGEFYQNPRAAKVSNGVYGPQNGKNMQNCAKNMKKCQSLHVFPF